MTDDAPDPHEHIRDAGTSTPGDERKLPQESSYLPESSRKGFLLGLWLMAASPVSNQTGAALGAMAFPVIGPVGVVAIRQFITAAFLVPLARPNVRSFTARQWWPIIAMALVFSAMNLSLYFAIEHLGIGLAVVLEFLGPLSVAIISSRRIGDGWWALLAAVGVVVLVRPGGASDLLGIALALVAACGWASYILLHRTLGRRLPRLSGAAAASLVTALAWIPVAVFWFPTHPATLRALLLALACGILASGIPYMLDPLALRRVPTHIFSTFTSVNPVVAALIGWILLGQSLAAWDWLGILLIVISNVAVTAVGLRRVALRR